MSKSIRKKQKPQCPSPTLVGYAYDRYDGFSACFIPQRLITHVLLTSMVQSTRNLTQVSGLADSVRCHNNSLQWPFLPSKLIRFTTANTRACVVYKWGSPLRVNRSVCRLPEGEQGDQRARGLLSAFIYLIFREGCTWT